MSEVEKALLSIPQCFNPSNLGCKFQFCFNLKIRLGS